MLRNHKLLMMAAAMGAKATLYGPEMMINGGFEISGTGGADIWNTWSEVAGNGAIADETTLVHGGGHSAKLTRGATASTYMQNFVDLVPGYEYRLQFWTRGDGTNQGGYALQENEAPYAAIIAEQSTGISGTNYQRIDVTFTPSIASVILSLVAPSGVGGVCYFDDMSIKVIEPTYGPEVFINGDFEIPGTGGADIWTEWAEVAGSGAIANEATLTHGGTGAAKMTKGASPDTYMQHSGVVTAGKMYRLQIWTRGDGTNAGRYALQIGEAPYTTIIAEVSTGITGTSYQLYEAVFTAPITSIILSLVPPAAEGGIAYFDDVSVKQLNP